MALVGISSWGRLGNWEHDVRVLNDRHHIYQLQSKGPGLAYGMGRSYGDVCLNPDGLLWNTTALDRFIHFDELNGRLVCEAGVLLRDIQRLVIPRGWILPVTPGTQFVTVGGAIANDIHGKNHYVHGTFGDHIQRLKIVRTDFENIECGPNINPEWFSATVGGLGLTGIIVEAEIQLRRVSGPWLNMQSMSYESLDEFFSLADASELKWEHTVSWIDCVFDGGRRGIFMQANYTDEGDRSVPQGGKLKVPFVPPISLVNHFTLRPFNTAYFNIKKRQAGHSVIHYEPFFYPLDNLIQWNRMYGPKGFYQYQSVIPRQFGHEALQEMLKVIARSGQGSFLAVLKTFGNRESPGMLSFPKPGITLALDFPNKGECTLKLFDRLDAIVREANGRLYCAKDSRMPRDLFESGYPRLQDFMKYRDPGISSSMSRRLMGS